MGRVRAHHLIVGVTTDLLFPIHQQEEIAPILREAGRDCRFVRIDSVHCHGAFLIETDRFSRIIQGVLDEPPPPPPVRRPPPAGDEHLAVGG